MSGRLNQGIVLVTIALACATSRGRPVAFAQDVSAAEAVAHVQAWIGAHPQDAAAYRALGRIEALAWAYGEKIPLVSTGSPNALPTFAETSSVLVERYGRGEEHWDGHALAADDRKDRPVTAEDAAHLAASMAAYRKAIACDPNDALSELGLGWMLAQQGPYGRELPISYLADAKPTPDESARWARAIGQLASDDPQVREAASAALLAAMPRCAGVLCAVKSDDPETNARIEGVLRDHFALEALGHYRQAFRLRVQPDMEGHPTYQTDSQVSAKAGAEILAILATHPAAAGPAEVKRIQEVLPVLAAKMEALRSQPQ